MLENRIALYHGLNQGGGLTLVHKIKNYLEKKGFIVDIYSTNQEIKFFNNFLGEIATCFYWLNLKDRHLSDIINQKYCYALVFPSRLVQIPNILRHLKINHCYMFLESKREFFEEVSFDHYSIYRSILRFLRYPICILDHYNAKFIKKCISVSHYSRYICRKIYKVNSTTISPLQKIKIKRRNINIPKSAVIIGPFSKIKGHDFSLLQTNDFFKTITLIGRSKSEEIQKFLIKNSLKVGVNFIDNPKSIFKALNKLPKHSIYLANNNYEPFGLSTIDAHIKKLFVVGKNIGGTSEIITSGVNGFLYPNNLQISKKVLKNVLNQKTITYYNNLRYDWSSYTDKLIYEITRNLTPTSHPQQS